MTNLSLIAVFNGQISNQSVQLCNARDLHAFIESKQDFSNWISNRIADYGFIQDEDYIIVTERTNGRPRKEYHITLDMGKELGMVERNEKGRLIRKYFIECERRLKQNPISAIQTRLPVLFDATQQTQLIALLDYVDYFISEVWQAITTLYPNCGKAQAMYISDMQILVKLLRKHLTV